MTGSRNNFIKAQHISYWNSFRMPTTTHIIPTQFLVFISNTRNPIFELIVMKSDSPLETSRRSVESVRAQRKEEMMPRDMLVRRELDLNLFSKLQTLSGSVQVSIPSSSTKASLLV